MPTITRVNKAASARETVYDRCAYMGCYNGKFINGRRLFHFPAETDKRLEMWIERSGNFRLRTWAATSLRKAGLCGDHFDDESFTNATRKTLRRNVVPRHYTEDLKFRNSKEKNRRELDISGEMSVKGETWQRDNFLNGVDSFYALPAEACFAYANRGDEICREFRSGKPIKLENGTRSSSPVVEFIVEELDESLVRETSRSSIGELESCSNVRDEERAAEAEERTTGPSIGVTTETYESPCTVEAESRDEEPTSNAAFEPEESDRLTVPRGEEEPRKAERNILTRLRNENKQLRRAMRLLKQNLRRSSLREVAKARTRKPVDEFLDAQGCTSPVARAMVKLALHKSKTPYTREEREFATRLYRNSSEAFDDLQRSGCNLPGRNTVKRWIAEDERKRTTEEFTTTTTTTTDEPGVELEESYPDEDNAGQTELMINANDTIEQSDNLEDPMSYVTRIIDPQDVAVYGLVAEHTEVQTEEYVDALTNDYHSEVFQ